MSFPLGVIACPAPAAADDHLTFHSDKPKKPANTSSLTEAWSFSSSFFDRDRPAKKPKSPTKNPHSLSSRAWVSLTRDRSDSGGVQEITAGVPIVRPNSSSTGSDRPSPHDSFDLPFVAPLSRSPSRPKHVPIWIPDKYSYVPTTPDFGSGSFSSYVSSASGSPVSSHPASTHDTRPNSARSVPRYVEIKIPDHAQPAFLSSQSRKSSVEKVKQRDSFIEASKPPTVVMSQSTPQSSRANTMDSHTSRPSPERLYANRTDNESNAALSSYSSQTSLVGMRSEYESASEAESTPAEDGAGSHTPSQTGANSSQSQLQTPSNNTSNLSGLVCNVHRTTGKEPHPLVGATTTILGDKLYVFGGRRLSRTKPQLTANLYELDLIKRHWTKLETKGDIPPPRYFHSVCALGDTKLVCYGGMSPAPAPELSADAQPEVIVMSDIHIFDVLTATWTKINTPDAPQGRYAHCAAILPSSAIFASQNAPMSAVQHNPAGNAPNQGSLGVALDGTGGAEMVVVGGQDSANHYIEQVSIFNLRSLKWTGTTGMGRSCGAYRSVVTPLTSMSAAQIGAGPHAQRDLEEDDDEPTAIGSGAPMLIYSNYNFLDVKLELQLRLTDGTLTEKPMQTSVSPPGLRFPNGGVIDNHFVVSGTFLTSSKQEYALWALDLRTLTWSRIDAGGSIFSQGSWNRGILWSRRNSFVILGNRRRSLVDDYNNRRINFSNICVVELEAFGLYENPKVAEPTSGYVSASAVPAYANKEDTGFGRLLSAAAEDIGALALNVRELADMDFLAIDGTRVPVNSRLIARRWGPHFISLLRESLASASDTDTATLRPNVSSHPSRNSSITITPSVNSGTTTLTNNSAVTELPDTRSAPPTSRPRLLYLPHTTQTIHALLHYLYTSTLPSPPHPLATPQIFCSLLQLARPYKIDGLLEATIEKMHECLDGRNAAAIFNATAMGAGGGDSVHFATNNRSIRESAIPIRTASLAGLDGLLAANGTPRSTGLRIDTDMANGRSARNTMRPGQANADDTSDDDIPLSAATDTSMSENELTLNAGSFTGRREKHQEIWTGALSSVIGLQKRGLRGLMEGRRMRERGRDFEAGRVGLGIA
ncbi:hypothetical protein PRZ48_001796 [Zasmidium cellare]|uniref:BTB domain-containing protein n=1 Tax=Zasmidium cellare TaxID=395010 RepID=A0ABR0F283_ZASCE|nr:hypothetical protein PRZ48_001796 [Zasmidium cellare]